MANNESFDIEDNNDLIRAAYSETHYDESHIETEEARDLMQSAKRTLALKAGVTDFYDDRGLAVALLGTTCAKMKGAVENSPVRVDNVGPNDVTFRTSDGSSIQITQYEDMTQTGLANSSKTDAGVQRMELTGTWLNDTRTA